MKPSEKYSEAKNLYESGLSIAECSCFYGISRQAMHKILLRRHAKMRTNNRGQKTTFKPATSNIYVDVAKLDVKIVDMVVAEYKNGSSIMTCSGMFGIGFHVINKILNYKNIKKRTTAKNGKDNGFYRGGSVECGKARDIAYAAIKKGILQRKPCEVCGAFGEKESGKNIIHAHHDDYNKPLTVRWLCEEHHYEWHKKNKAKGIEAGRPTEKTDTTIDLLTAGPPCQ